MTKKKACGYRIKTNPLPYAITESTIKPNKEITPWQNDNRGQRKSEALKAKIESNFAEQAKLIAKIEELKEIENGFRKELDNLKNAAKEAEKAKEAKAKKAALTKAEKELIKVIRKSGLTPEEVKAKLGI